MSPLLTKLRLRQGDKSLSEAIADQMCQEIATEADAVLAQATRAMTAIQRYEGCRSLIQKSIRSPSDTQLTSQALAALAPNVRLIQSFHETSLVVEPVFSALIQLSSRKSTKRSAGFLMDKVASLLDFAVCFDNIKAVKPDIQNDLSFFRRLATVCSMTNQIESIADAPLNTLSFFVAEHNPMTKALVRAVEDAMKKEPASVSVMAQLANSLFSAVANQKVKDDRHSLRTLRAMTGAILVYDHTNTTGAFGSKSEIKIKRCLKELASRQAASQGATAALLDTIRYSSLHFSDAETPDKLRQLVDK